MTERKFHERFNLSISSEEARQRFVHRIQNEIANLLAPIPSEFENRIKKAVYTRLGIKDRSGSFFTIIGDDFWRNVEAAEALYWVFHSDLRANSAQIASLIKSVIELSEVDIGIRWHESGHFLSSGSELLDARLANDILGVLGHDRYRGVLIPFSKGLEQFMHSIARPQLLADAVRDMYEAMESLAKITTGRGDRDLSANRDLFISKIQISEDYKPLMKEYIVYGNKIRHAGKDGRPKPPLVRKEVESFIYLTGLFIRLAVMDESQA